MGFVEIPDEGLINLDHVQSVLFNAPSNARSGPGLTFNFTDGGGMTFRFNNRTERDKVIEAVLGGGNHVSVD